MATALIRHQDEWLAVHDEVSAPRRSEVDEAVLVLNDNGMIRECNEASGRMFGCLPSALVWQHVSMLLPQLADVALMQGGAGQSPLAVPLENRPPFRGGGMEWRTFRQRAFLQRSGKPGEALPAHRHLPGQ